MELVGIGIIGVAAAVETTAAILFVLRWLSPNPHMPYAMLSGVAFAVAGLLLYLA
jgi:hypothetical protein